MVKTTKTTIATEKSGHIRQFGTFSVTDCFYLKTYQLFWFFFISVIKFMPTCFTRPRDANKPVTYLKSQHNFVCTRPTWIHLFIFSKNVSPQEFYWCIFFLYSYSFDMVISLHAVPVIFCLTFMNENINRNSVAAMRNECLWFSMIGKNCIIHEIFFQWIRNRFNDDI